MLSFLSLAGAVSPDDVGVVVGMFNINEGNVSVFVDFLTTLDGRGFIDELEVVPKKANPLTI